MKSDTHSHESGDSVEKITLGCRIRRCAAAAWRALQPEEQTRRCAAAGLVVLVTVLVVVTGVFIQPGFPGFLDGISGILILAVFVVLLGASVGLALKLLSLLPRFITGFGLIAFIVLLFIMMQFNFPFPMALTAALLLGGAQAFLGGSLAILSHRDFKFKSFLRKSIVFLAILIPLALDAYLVVWLAGRGSGKHLTVKTEVTGDARTLDMPNPARLGTYRVLRMTYGSGSDKHRLEYGKEADIKTDPVDATVLVKGNKGWQMALRKWYWGFDVDAFPVNGRIWYPEGDGPFPLVLIVHGNHKMEDFSDPGYAYLGELLASRGFIFVSVDENFFNGSFFSGLKRENDGRGWMLLKHLEAWREWNRTSSNPFFGKVDMENIGLIGHSRGGEAAAIAGAFNRLKHYPDDATLDFDFGFNIKAICAIAPSDGQYKPAGRPTPLENVNYLTLQGAHDSDVAVFVGIRQYNRVKFTDGRAWFKAAVYSYRSNHGQFNTTWGDNDWGRPAGWMVNRKPLLDGEEQRKLGKVTIAAFLECALHGETGYLPFFRDTRRGIDWLPDDIFINRFEDSSFSLLAGYDDDVDVTTGSRAGVEIGGKNLTVWREEDLSFRSGGTKKNTVAYIGWGKPEAEEIGEEPAVYTLKLPPDFGAIQELTPDSRLVFTLAEADEDPPEPEEEAEKNLGNKNTYKKEDDKGKAEKNEEDTPIEFSVELIDGSGTAIRRPIMDFMPVPPIIRSRFSKLPGEKRLWKNDYEPTMQTFELPLHEFLEDAPGFDPRELQEIRFVFDRTPKGVVILDNIGLGQ